jgi:hypothetical protein
MHTGNQFRFPDKVDNEGKLQKGKVMPGGAQMFRNEQGQVIAGMTLNLVGAETQCQPARSLHVLTRLSLLSRHGDMAGGVVC